jgi:hypothetical protein
MTNKMKIVFVLSAVMCASLVVMLSTPLVIDTGSAMLSSLGHALGLHDAPISSTLAVLGIPFLYLVFMKTKSSWNKRGGA